jgi:hypothetical protein
MTGKDRARLIEELQPPSVNIVNVPFAANATQTQKPVSDGGGLSAPFRTQKAAVEIIPRRLLGNWT